ncbi:MAG TPA: GGDEF domain-containing protein [Dehalococcoidia bacterium]|nr:GGDEF domain-containing protein [Dehalococcoidia bacterium]
MQEQTTKDLMSSSVLCAPPDASAEQLVALMHENAFSCIVISEYDRPVGIVTERDVVGVLHSVLRGEASGDQPASEFMSTPVITILEDRPVFEAMVFCRSRNVRHLPVVDRQGRLVGLLTQSDLTEHHLHSIEEERARLEDPDIDAGDLMAANERLRALAHEDPLLGIGNRRAMEVDLQYTHESGLRYSTSYAVAVCDVDYFKLYNDTYGHQAGDELLRHVVDYLRSGIRKSDRLYRYGGDELLILLPMTSLESAKSTVGRLLGGLDALEIEHAGSPLGLLTVSCGISALHPKRRRILSWKQVFDEADHALYKVKRSGRSGVATFKGREKVATLGKDGSPYRATAASRL